MPPATSFLFLWPSVTMFILFSVTIEDNLNILILFPIVTFRFLYGQFWTFSYMAVLGNFLIVPSCSIHRHISIVRFRLIFPLVSCPKRYCKGVPPPFRFCSYPRPLWSINPWFSTSHINLTSWEPLQSTFYPCRSVRVAPVIRRLDCFVLFFHPNVFIFR